MRTAIVIGGTGLVGSHLIDLLLTDTRFTRVKAFLRRPSGKFHPKLEESIIDFNKSADWNHLVKGDVLFSALGTTIRKAGSKAEQYKIDYTYQYNFAKAAAENGVGTYVLVSSAGASPTSKIFYSRMKGELERDIAELNFKHIHIIQPGILSGERKEARLGEKIGIAVLSLAQYIPSLKGYKPIHAGIVAQAMINASFNEKGTLHVYTLQKVFDLAKALPDPI